MLLFPNCPEPLEPQATATARRGCGHHPRGHQDRPGHRHPGQHRHRSLGLEHDTPPTEVRCRASDRRVPTHPSSATPPAYARSPAPHPAATRSGGQPTASTHPVGPRSRRAGPRNHRYPGESALCVGRHPATTPLTWPFVRAAPVSARRASSECSPADGVRREGEGGALCDKIFRRILASLLAAAWSGAVGRRGKSGHLRARWCRLRGHVGTDRCPRRCVVGRRSFPQT